MVITEKIKFPDDAELTVEEINVPYPILHAAGPYVGKKCENENNEFMLCRFEERDPRACLNEGKAVTACALEFFKKLKKHCREDFEKYIICLEDSSKDYSFAPCRHMQKTVDTCILENLKIERPPFGYFCTNKIHETSRPLPERGIKFKDPIPPLPSEKPEHPARFGSKHNWYV